MSVVKKELDYAKECGDVMVLFRDLAEDIRAGKSAGELAAENLPGLMAAITGAQNIGDEVEQSRRAVMATVGYHAGELTDALLPQKEVTLPPVA